MGAFSFQTIPEYLQLTGMMDLDFLALFQKRNTIFYPNNTKLMTRFGVDLGKDNSCSEINSLRLMLLFFGEEISIE